MKLIFADAAWEDYLFWQQQDKRMVERINKLIKEVQPSFGLVSGSQRLLTSPGGQSKTATRVETGIDSLRSAFAAD